MTPKVFTVLGVVAAASLVAAGAASSVLSDRISEVTASGVLIPDLIDRVNEAAKLEITEGGRTLAVERRGEGWVLPDKGDYPADAAKVRSNLVGLAELRLVEPKTRKPEFYDRLEVEDPGLKGAKSRLFEVFDAGGATLASVVVGRKRQNVEGRNKPGVYVRLSAEDRTWLAGGDLKVSTVLSDWLDSKLFDLTVGDIARLAADRPNVPAIAVSRDPQKEQDFIVEDVPEGFEAKSAFELDQMIRRLLRVEFDDMRLPVDAGEPTVTVELTAKSGLHVVVRLYRQSDQTWVEVEARGEGAAADGARAINDRFRGWQFGLSDDYLKDLAVNHGSVLKIEQDEKQG